MSARAIKIWSVVILTGLLHLLTLYAVFRIDLDLSESVATPKFVTLIAKVLGFPLVYVAEPAHIGLFVLVNSLLWALVLVGIATLAIRLFRTKSLKAAQR